ncbi:hypothetical protein OGAPHI_002574 [Ogataea philodendri]|uniref:Uncharacterized protein n=1 Tax=Ogataea philodendri TaxID=1378263 RepID=A0A9P8PCN5_9ASCO|nr:uncharacterized protein OGAPHI_002574 [Ogataea philodendri]KAH3668819.1 hypothetical protein OGAPHI_002574 [Ogataea philodendri]
MSSFPSYLLKLTYGYELQRRGDRLKSYEQPKSKQDIRDTMVTRLSTNGILGSSPALFNQNEEYIDKLVDILKSKGLEKASAMASNELDNDESEAEEFGGNVDDSMTQTSEGLNFNSEDSSNVFSASTHLPSRWITPKDCQFELSLDGLEISTKNPAKPVTSSSSSITVNLPNHSQTGVFSTKANHIVPESIGIYYYEVEIVFGLSSGADVTVGFMDGDHPEEIISSLRGHDENTWGYKGKDAKLIHFEDGRTNFKSSCKFGNKDVVGCGVNFINDSIFITKNGAFLGEAFQLPSHINKVIPAISLGAWNSVSTNFGLSKPFRFNIDNYVESFKLDFKKKVLESGSPWFALNEHSSDPDNTTDTKTFIDRMIKKYFDHNGYGNALKAFNRELKEEGSTEPEGSVRHENGIKKHIRTLIKANRVDDAIDTINSNFPSLLQDNQSVLFKLECLKLISVIGDKNESDFLKYAQNMRSRYPSEPYHKTLDEISALLAYNDPKQTALYKTFTDFERDRVIFNLSELISAESGLPTKSNFAAMIEKAQSLESECSNKEMRLVNILSDFVDI